MSRRLSPNKDVCAEAAILQRLGFQYTGLTGSGHLLFEHPEHGEIVMAGTPRDWHWRRSHRRGVAKAMLISPFQLGRLIAGQPTEARPRKSAKRAGRRRNRAPRALRVVPDVEKKPEPVPPQPEPVRHARRRFGLDSEPPRAYAPEVRPACRGCGREWLSDADYTQRPCPGCGGVIARQAA